MKGDKLSDRWRTPKWLADALGLFGLDPCSGPGSYIQTLRTIRPPEDGLADAWDLGDGIACSVFVNPPYSYPDPWAARLRRHPAPWAALVKLDPSTRWWADLMAGCDAWRAFKRRIRFEPPPGWEGKPSSGKFASALVMGGGWTPSKELEKYLW